jgi:uncharacterized protein
MTALPEIVDAWRSVTARRRFEGSIRVRDMPRLRESLARDDGSIRYELEFGRDELQVPYLQLSAEGRLPLECQRTLEPFELEVSIHERLGLIAREEDEAALPPGYEPLLTPSGELKLADVIEDELILALPVVPLKPGSETENEVAWSTAPPDDASGPFAELARLKKR